MEGTIKIEVVGFFAPFSITFRWRSDGGKDRGRGQERI